MKDVIEREIIVKASREQVYQAITDPKQIVAWFPSAVEDGALKVGERSTLVFDDHKHRAQIYVEAAEPFEYFAYRWVPGGVVTTEDVLAVPNTLVEFRLEGLSQGTKVVLKESGFASLPAKEAKTSLDQNSGGWNHMLARLEKLMNKA